MKRALIALLLVLGCSRAPAPKAPTSPAQVLPTEVASVAPPATHDGLCEGAPRIDDGLDDVMFGACDAFVPRFESSLARSCAPVVPTLANALRGLDDTRDATGIYAHERDARDQRLGEVAMPYVKARCPGMQIAGDDWGRSAWELIREDDWRSCAPDRDYVDAYTTWRSATVEYAATDTPIGHWLFAMAIGPKLTSRGAHMMRKYLVCERLERNAAERAPDHRGGFRQYLVTPP
jgi:hypothetical protein